MSNGILFRADVHKLFDAGYVTVTPDYHFEVSHRIKEEFEIRRPRGIVCRTRWRCTGTPDRSDESLLPGDGRADERVGERLPGEPGRRAG